MTPQKFIGVILVVGIASVPLHANGRRPANDQDTYPDYNRLDMHPKTLEPPTAPTSPPAPTPLPPVFRPSLNAPVNPAASSDDVPQPPPQVVPVPAEAPEPPMPDDLMNTLVPSTTGQK